MINIHERVVPFHEGMRIKDLAECFDDAVMKAAALRTLLTYRPGVG